MVFLHNTSQRLYLSHPVGQEVFSWCRCFSDWTICLHPTIHNIWRYPSPCVMGDTWVFFCCLMFLHVVVALQCEYQTQETVLLTRPVRTELCDKQARHQALTTHSECDHPLHDKSLPLPSGICNRRPKKRSNSYKHPFIPAAIKWLNKPHC